jgi:pyruvate/2-oxoglutarate/acetoin dehydrogenase E1 component
MTTVLQSLNHGLVRAMEKDENVFLLGEDILDPYGGAFKVTRGISTRFPGRVLSTPISEAAITGLATGMALRGLRPVIEIMFGDFITLAADQIINHAAKFRWMYNDQVRVPWVLRTPMGGRRGYGPTHSQTLEKLFLGIPGLNVIAPFTVGEPGRLLEEIILTTQDPVIFIENKLQYLLEVGAGFEEFTIQTSPDSLGTSTALLAIDTAPPPRVTLVAYGYMADLARQAMLRLAYEEEIFSEMVVFEKIAPLSIEPLLKSLARTGRLLVIEEGTRSSGWGSEVLAKAMEEAPSRLKAALRLGAAETPVPSSGPLEASTLPDVQDILDHTLALMSV